LEKIVAEYTFWYIPLCLLAGLMYATILYYRETRNEFGKPLRWILAILRMIVISGIAFLLLNPLIRSVKKRTEKPVVLILQDNSESITLGKDSMFYKSSYPELADQFTRMIQTDFAVRSFLFGEDLQDGPDIDFSAQQTNMGNAFDAIYNRYSHKNIGALVLLSDGINNMGLNPLYSDHNFHFPVYTVALGDTSLQRDIILSRVNFNRIAYLDNMFPLEINLTGKKCKGLSTILTIERNEKVLYRNSITFNSDNDFKTVQTTLDTEETGLQKYTIRLSSVNGEITLANNSLDIFIDVLEDKQKILLLADAPHPDISAIKQSVAENINYQLDDFLISEFNGSVNGYNLIIMHGVPSVRNNGTPVLQAINEKNIPALFILTKKTFLPVFNEQRTGLTVGTENLIYNEALPFLNRDFNLFSLSDKTMEAIHFFPPLVSPYGNLQLSPSAKPLFFQQIGSVVTKQPMWVFNQSMDKKTGMILGPGLWKWKIKEFSTTAAHDAFNDILNKTIQYLALKVDKSLFRVYGQNNYAENDDIEFEAELYNELYELVNDKEISITITGSDGASFPFVFTKTSNSYFLNAGNFLADNYTYFAQVISGGKTFTEKGEFTVSTKKLENLNTMADHNLLYNLAQKHGGEMVYPGQMDELAEKIKNREDIKTITYYQKRFSELLNLPFLLGLIMLLLSAEWFIRKRAGGY